MNTDVASHPVVVHVRESLPREQVSQVQTQQPPVSREFLQYLGKVMYERASLSGIHRMNAVWGELTELERGRWVHLALYVWHAVKEQSDPQP